MSGTIEKKCSRADIGFIPNPSTCNYQDNRIVTTWWYYGFHRVAEVTATCIMYNCLIFFQSQVIINRHVNSPSKHGYIGCRASIICLQCLLQRGDVQSSCRHRLSIGWLSCMLRCTSLWLKRPERQDNLVASDSFMDSLRAGDGLYCSCVPQTLLQHEDCKYAHSSRTGIDSLTRTTSRR